MRSPVTQEKLAEFMEGVGRLAKGEGRVYLVGGATALLLQIRPQTVDIDIKLDPEPVGVFEALAELKESLDINVELAAPDQFLPALPGWRQRSIYLGRRGSVEFFHYDLYGQVLAKILRGFERDLKDAEAFVRLGYVHQQKLSELFNEIKGELIRYPAIDPAEFERRVQGFVGQS